jgi:hypothetical protein
MKTLMVILGLVIGTALGANAQAQAQAQTKPNATTHATSQPAAQAPTQTQSQTKTMIKVSELSKPIQNNLAAQFKSWTPMQAYRLDSKGTISYEVMVKKEANEMMLVYDKEGKLMKEQPVTAMKPETKKETTPAKQEAQAVPAQKPASKPK